MCVLSVVPAPCSCRADESPFIALVEREALEGIPNVYSHQTFFETDQAGFIIRQWVSSSLYDRIRCLVVSFTIQNGR